MSLKSITIMTSSQNHAPNEYHHNDELVHRTMSLTSITIMTSSQNHVPDEYHHNGEFTVHIMTTHHAPDKLYCNIFIYTKQIEKCEPGVR